MKMSNKKQRNNETFFRKNCFTKIKDKTVFFNEIVNHNEFRKMFLAEEPSLEFFKGINTNTLKPFFNIPSSISKEVKIKTGDVLPIRISNENKVYEIISKTHDWGKVNVPNEVINKLKIKHKQKVKIELIQRSFIHNKEEFFLKQLFKDHPKIKLIDRASGLITLYSKGHLPITLPNKLRLTSKLIEAFFLIHGDGHYKSKLFFVNNNPNLQKFVIKIFHDELKIPPSIWRGRVNLNESLSEEFAISFWMKELNFNLEQLYPTVSKTKFKTPPNGNLRIVIDKLIVAELFRTIFNHIKANLNQHLSFHALNGLLAAEGSADIGSKGLHKITLSYNKEEKELFKVILDNCGLSYLFKDRDLGKKGQFVLEGWNNFLPFFNKFLEKDIVPFRLHQKRKNNAFTGLNEHSFTKTMHKYLLALKQKEDFTVKELSAALNIREDSCLSTIRKQKYSKFINMKGKGINRNPFIVSISQDGKDLLNSIKDFRRYKNSG